MRIRKSILLTVTAAIAVGAFATSASAQEVDAKVLLEQMMVLPPDCPCMR